MNPDQLKVSLEYYKTNPTDPKATEFNRRLKSGNYDSSLQQLGLTRTATGIFKSAEPVQEVSTGEKTIGGKITDVLFRNTKQLGQVTSDAFKSQKVNQELQAEADKYIQAENTLMDAYASAKRAGQDTTKLEQDIQALRANRPDYKSKVTDRMEKNAERSFGQNLALGLGAGMETAGLLLPAGKAVSAFKGGSPILSAALNTGKTTALYGAGQSGLGAISEGKSAGQVLGSTALGALTGYAGGVTIGAGTNLLGKAAGKVPELVSEQLSGASTKLKGLKGKLGKIDISKNILGEEASSYANAANNKYAQEFFSGKRKVANVVKDFDVAMKDFQDKSKGTLTKVKSKLSNTNVNDKDIVFSRVNDAIQNTIKGASEYKGVGANLNTVDDLIKYGVIQGEEATKVKGVVNFINDWADMSDRGILNLKESLDTFYKSVPSEQATARKVISNIQNSLKDFLGESNPKLKSALLKSHEDIKAQNLLKEVFGGTARNRESKILSFMNKLKSEPLNADNIELIKLLDKTTKGKYKLLDQMAGWKDYQLLSSIKDPGLLGGDSLIGGIKQKVRYEAKKRLAPMVGKKPLNKK